MGWIARGREEWLVIEEEIVSGPFLLHVLNGIEFVDPWSKVVGVSPEGDLQQGEELIHGSE
ncbi:hypothetical protein DKP78_16350 [Enterococcus faecium]|nr:hypothetical protein DKP78_16350 [Enterococcus faecium]